MKPQNSRSVGLVLLGIAIFVGYFALMDHSLQPGRRWVMAAVAIIFLLAALQLLLVAKGRLSFFLGGFVFALFSVCGFYIAFSSEFLEGGMPFVPATWNQSIGHALFGLGATITAGGALYFFRRALEKNTESSEP